MADSSHIHNTSAEPQWRRRGPRGIRRLSTLAKINILVVTLGLLVLVGWYYLLPLYHLLRYEPRRGDLIFQSLPHGRLVDTIEGVSASPLSHCGIVVERDGEWSVLEAIGPVKETGLFQWIRRGRGYRFAVYRLREPYRDRIETFIAEARRHLGKPYDRLYELDDEKLYCSELIFKAFQAVTGEELGTLCKLGELNWKPFRKNVVHFAGGDHVPTDREMITPVALTRANQLELVHSSGLR